MSNSQWLKRLQGDGSGPPPKPPLPQILKSALGGLLAMLLVGALAQASDQPLVLGSLGASCVMLFGFPELPFSQPRHVLGGHLLSSLVGLVCLHWLGSGWWFMALAVALSIALMMALRVTHPPAGSNPVIIFLSHAGWGFLLMPVLVGVLLLLLVALVYNNMTRDSAYPKYW